MRRIGLALLLVWLAGSPVAALKLDTLPNFQDAGMKLYVRGTQKIQEKDYVGAVDDLRQAVRARPDLAEAFQNLGYAFERTGNLKDAARAYERALTLNPNYAAALNNLGYLLATTETDKTRSVQLCQRAVELEPDSASFRDSLGWACYKAGRQDDAIMHFKAALKIDPVFFKSHFNLGMCYFQTKNLAEAAREFTETIKCNPGYLKAYIPLAVCYEMSQQNGKAAYVYQQALTKAPEGSNVRRHIEKCLKKLNSDSKSYYFANVKQMQGSSRLTEFMKQKQLSGRISGSTSRGGDQFETSGTFTPVSVSPALSQAREPSPTVSPTSFGSTVGRPITGNETLTPAPSFRSPAAISTVRSDSDLSVEEERQLEKKYALCQSYLDRGLVNEAANELERIVSQSGMNSTVGRQARSLLLKARKAMEERTRESAQTHHVMGKDFFRAGKFDMAENEFLKALDMDPENAEVFKDLALLHYNQGRLKEAYEESKKAIALDRGLKEAYVVLGSLYSKKGRVEEAVRTLRKVREVSRRRDAVDDLAERMIAGLSSGS